MKNKIIFSKAISIILGAGALLWFLVRVIPKPSRATYPCQRAAFPIASAFVVWLISLPLSVFFIRKAKMLFLSKHLVKGFAFLLIGLTIFLGSKLIFSPKKGFGQESGYYSANNQQFEPEDPSNSPMGVARGIHPGRVVWVYNPEATSWDGSSQWWWDDNNIAQTEIDSMVKNTVLWLTGKDDVTMAWDTIFRYFNYTHGNGNTGYSSGERIAIKVNMNRCDGLSAPNNTSKASPQVVLAYITHLIEFAGVIPEDITVYDKSKYISKGIYEKVSAKYPSVRYMDTQGQPDKSNWSAYQVDYNSEINWSENLTLETEGGNPTYLPKTVSEAAYIINIANLKGHNLTGVTMCAKNHFGTFYSHSAEYNYYGPKAAGVHPYISVHDYGTCGGNGAWDMCMRDMATYNPLVDIMGHKDMGNKTLLFILDALYCSKDQDWGLPEKWSMPPFNGDWTSSIFISQDGVAIESVGLDYLRSEPSQQQVYGNVDNYLHEAALANDPPSGTFYDPDGEGAGLNSLGVHEHWNNVTDKQYSRNLGTGTGIELFTGQQLVPKIGEITTNYHTGSYSGEILVTLRSPINDADIFYTTDGSTPTEVSSEYDASGIPINKSTTLKVVAFKEGFQHSDVYTFNYQIEITDLNSAKNPKLRIYPNPVKDFLIIENSNMQPIDVQLVTLTGKYLRSYSITNKMSLNISDLKPGIYFLICDTYKNKHIKIVKE